MTPDQDQPREKAHHGHENGRRTNETRHRVKQGNAAKRPTRPRRGRSEGGKVL